MQNATLWRALQGVEKTVVEEIEYDEDEQFLVAHVRPRARARNRCGRCLRRAPAYDRGEGRRRWRALDLGTIQVVLEALHDQFAGLSRIGIDEISYKRGHRYLTVGLCCVGRSGGMVEQSPAVVQMASASSSNASSSRCWAGASVAMS